MHTLLTAGTASLALAASLAAATAAPVTFSSAGSTFQSFTAPETGTYDIVAFGAQGGTNDGRHGGGLGAEIGGDFTLAAGETLSIAVGTMGVGNYGGGGGSFVVGPGSTPLVIAGGGGGGFVLSQIAADILANEGQASTAGGTPLFGGGGVIDGAGGTGGNGGSRGFGSGGGGGFYSAGQDGVYGPSTPVGGGGGYPSLLGGKLFNIFASGGFGGGGSGSADGGMPGSPSDSGGGGGFSGGGGGYDYGGGGGSFDAGTNQVLVAGFNSGDGSVVITELSAIPVPEPASLALLGVGIAGLLSVRRRCPG